MFSFDLNLILWPALGAFSFLCVFSGLWLLLKSIRNKGDITRALNIGLLAVTLPYYQDEKKEDKRSSKEIIGVMEQVFASFVNMREKGLNKFLYSEPYIVLEIGTPKGTQEAVFYFGAPKRYLEIAKKVVYGFYPSAQVQEIKDYNIFEEGGATAGSYVSLKNNHFLPIKTYQSLDSDPLIEIVNTLTKLEEKSEGGSFQLILRPAQSGWNKKARKILEEMERGKTFDQAKEIAFRHPLLDALMRSGKQEPPTTATPAPVVSLSTRKRAEAVQGKISKSGFECNLRLLASASTIEQAEQILSQMESAFSQFESPELNGFKINRLTKSALRRLIYNFSFRIFNSDQKILLNAEELTSVFHFSVSGSRMPRLKALKAKDAPPPPGLPTEGIILGKNVYRGVETIVRMSPDDRRRHLYVVGQTGTGKSYFLRQLAAQDMATGQGIAFFDPHGEEIENLLGLVPKERTEDVIVFDPGDLERPLGLNMLEYNPQYPEQKTFIVNEMINIFDRLYDLKQTGGPMFEQYMRNALLLLMDDPREQATLMDVPRVFADPDYRAKLLSKCQNGVTRDFWEKEAEKAGGEAALQNITPYVTSKFNTFVANDYMRPIISQPKSAFNFREVMDSGKILLVNLSKGRLGDINSNLLGMILVGKLTMAALSRVDIAGEQRRDFFLYIDEFQSVTTDSISTILSEARKYRLNLTVGHQYIKQLQEKIRDAVFGNVGSICAFRVGSEDAEFLAKQFEPVFTAADLMSVDNRKAYVKLLINGMTALPFNLEALSGKESDLEYGQKVKELSRLKYGKLSL